MVPPVSPNHSPHSPLPAARALSAARRGSYAAAVRYGGAELPTRELKSATSSILRRLNRASRACRRFKGEYVHKKFCETLTAVAMHATAAIWLPRARKRAPLSYPFRLWCTFEASVVAQRSLPVYLAGEGLRLPERWLMVCGVYTPALPLIAPPPAETRELSYLVTLIYYYYYYYHSPITT